MLSVVTHRPSHAPSMMAPPAAAPRSPRGSIDHVLDTPSSFFCPISHAVMHDPVVLSDGHSYERKHIDRWLRSTGTSPVTREKVAATLYPNHALRNAIDDFFESLFSNHRRAIRRSMVTTQTARGEVTSEKLLRKIDALMNTALVSNSDLPAEHVLRRIVDEAVQLVGAETGSVFLVDETRKELVSSLNSHTDKTGERLRIPLSSGFAGHVASTGKALLVPDAYKDTSGLFNKNVDKRTGFRTQSLLCVPILGKQRRVLGVVQLINKKPDTNTDTGKAQDAFSAEDADFLRVFAAQAAGALVNLGTLDDFLALAPTSPPLPVGPTPAEAAVFDSVESKLQIKSQQLAAVEVLHVVIEDEPSAPPEESEPSAPVVARPAETEVVEDEAEALDLPKKKTEEEEEEEKAEVEAPMDAAYTVARELERAQTWRMDTLALDRATRGRPLSTLAMHLFDLHGLVEILNLDRPRLARFLELVECGYAPTDISTTYAPYHNRAHAASVLHVLHAIVINGGVADAILAGRNKKDDDDKSPAGGGEDKDDGARERDRALLLLSTMLAAIIHDFDHLGLSNAFLVNTEHERAILYNDQCVNEQHHAAAAFALLRRPDCAFLNGALAQKEWAKLRKRVVQLVLSTDMAKHKSCCSQLKALLLQRRLGGGGKDGDSHGRARVRINSYMDNHAMTPKTDEEEVTMLQVALKCADLGHLTLEQSTHERWVRRLELEFFAQGDKEKVAGIEPSFLCDRTKPGVRKSQVGFFKFVVTPLFDVLLEAFPTCVHLCTGVHRNFNMYKRMEEEEEEEDSKASSSKAAVAAPPPPQATFKKH